jgi:hypothetical protein
MAGQTHIGPPGAKLSEAGGPRPFGLPEIPAGKAGANAGRQIATYSAPLAPAWRNRTPLPGPGERRLSGPDLGRKTDEEGRAPVVPVPGRCRPLRAEGVLPTGWGHLRRTHVDAATGRGVLCASDIADAPRVRVGTDTRSAGGATPSQRTRPQRGGDHVSGEGSSAAG